jgi:hypothetical protein
MTPRYPYQPLIVDYNTYIRESLVPDYKALGRNISTVDMYPLFLSNTNDVSTVVQGYLSNGINHPTNEKYDEMAQEWFDGIWRLGLLDPTVLRIQPEPGALRLDWHSKSGKQYALRSAQTLSDPLLTWPVFGSNSNLTHISKGHGLPVPLSNNASRFFAVEENDF